MGLSRPVRNLRSARSKVLTKQKDECARRRKLGKRLFVKQRTRRLSDPPMQEPERTMKIIERKPAAKGEDLLTTVARSIGSTLGTVARKVRPSSRKPTRRRAKRKSPRKLGTASKNHRQG